MPCGAINGFISGAFIKQFCVHFWKIKKKKKFCFNIWRLTKTLYNVTNDTFAFCHFSIVCIVVALRKRVSYFACASFCVLWCFECFLLQDQNKLAKTMPSKLFWKWCIIHTRHAYYMLCIHSCVSMYALSLTINYNKCFRMTIST